MSIQLTGIDGSDPLGFFAALGVLRILHDKFAEHPTYQLSWSNEGAWRPSIQGVDNINVIIEAVIDDLQSWKNEPAIGFEYTKNAGNIGAEEKGAIRDLKPPPDLQKSLFVDAANTAKNHNTRTTRTLTSFGTDVALDSQNMIKPTALHFTAGKQQFLGMVNGLRKGLTSDHIEEALVGPWLGESTLPSLSWTGTGQRLYALRARDPSKDKRGSTPGAEWLAFLGLSFFPCVPKSEGRGPRVLTTCVRGEWGTEEFTWPLWAPAISLNTLESLLRMEKLGNPSGFIQAERDALGISVIFRSKIVRTDQGGYGSFTPPEVV